MGHSPFLGFFAGIMNCLLEEMFILYKRQGQRLRPSRKDDAGSGFTKCLKKKRTDHGAFYHLVRELQPDAKKHHEYTGKFQISSAQFLACEFAWRTRGEISYMESGPTYSISSNGAAKQLFNLLGATKEILNLFGATDTYGMTEKGHSKCRPNSPMMINCLTPFSSICICTLHCAAQRVSMITKLYTNSGSRKC